MFAYTMIGAVSAAAAYAYVKGERSEVEYKRSTVDNRQYLVQRGAGSDQAADTLGKIVTDIEALIRHMKEKYPKDERVIRMEERFNPNAISEGSHTSGYTSYSVSKSSIVMCLRQEDNSFAPPNVVMYVALHELAHLATDTIGHDSTYWKNFRDILKEAIAIGIYKKQDYAKTPQPYCGITIDSSVI